MEKSNVTEARVVVLGGGWSDEREVSLKSAEAVTKALRQAGFTSVEMLDPASEGAFIRLASGSYDVAFVAMHGRFGEDGRIQGLLETIGLPHTFSGVLACATGAEKEVAKALYREAGLTTPQGEVLPSGTKLLPADAEALVERFGLPLFVKPAANGSSFGVSRVTDVAELPDAVEKAQAGGDSALVESCITGTEVTVPVIGNSQDAEALPVVEIAYKSDFYDEKVKYEPAALHHIIPARLPREVYELTQEQAIVAHKALGCAGVSRSDFIVTPEGIPTILETNVIPGMTENSLLPDAARHAGISFSELCRRFVEMALAASDGGAR